MTTETDIQATYEKWLGSRADDPTLPHDLIRDAFLAGVEAERQTRGQPAVGEEIHVHIEGLDVLTLPLASSGIGAPRFVVHVPAQPDVSLTPDVQTDRQDRMPSDAEILACLRPLYSNDVAAAMGAEDDLRTARLLLSRYAAPVAAQAQPTMPPLTEAMRAVLRNGNDVYGDEDALYAALCDAAPLNHFPDATKMVQSSGNATLDAMERALTELVDKIVPGLDTGDLVADATTASKALDRAQPSGNAGELPAVPDGMEQLAVNRYRPVPSGVIAYKVVCGDGERSLFSGTKDECYIVARKLTEAFLDGAHVALAAQAQPVVNQSLTTESDREAMADEFEAWWINVGQYLPACRGANYKKTFAYRAYEHAYDVGFRAALAQQPSGQSQRQPDGYAYRYRSTFGDGTVIRFNRGEEVNGSLPIDAVPFWYAPPDCAQDREDAQRWRYMRRKLCLTGNGNGTCAMQAINLPVAIPGWPEPGRVAEFCDTAIDAAIANDRAAAKERT